MRRLILSAALCLALSGVARAQASFASEASVDQETYGYGETITFRFVVRNEGTETATVWGGSGCAPEIRFGSLETPGEGGVCTQAEIPYTFSPGEALTWIWRLDPAQLGVPETDGAQTVTVRFSGRCGPGGPESPSSRSGSCGLGTSASFEAPRYLGGVLRLRYQPTVADSVAALRQSHRTTVTDSTAYRLGIEETWQIEGAPLADAVGALDANGVIDHAEVYRPFGPSERFETAEAPRPEAAQVTPPAPNPAATTATFTVRLTRPGTVVVDLVDLLGRRVAMLHNGPLAGGVDHGFVLSTETLPAGVYVVRVVGETVRQSQRVTVAR